MTHCPNRSEPWSSDWQHRMAFLVQLTAAAQGVRPTRSLHPRGFAVRCELTPSGLGPRVVTIDFPRDQPDSPRVWVSGHPTSPHRYTDGSLCMWHPHDPPERRWTWGQGAQQLAAQVCAHLLRERWWYLTGEWLGEEAPHDL